MRQRALGDGGTTPVARFSDFRAFLLAHAQDSKRRRKGWTYGVFARQLGLKDTSSITKIVRGQRAPGPELTGRLIRYFELNAKDAEYFRDLVRLEKVKGDARLTVLLLEKMGKDHPDRALRVLDLRAFELVSSWHCTAIREMAKLKGFREDADWIRDRLFFPVTATEARRAIELLLEAGLLRRDSKGKLRVAEGRFRTTEDLASEAIRRYHEAMLEKARDAIHQVAVEKREMTACCLTMRADRIGEAKELIREFRSRFAKLMEEEKGDLTAQLQIQFFPLTRLPGVPPSSGAPC